MKGLTILSFGAGQDSAALLNLAIHDSDFRDKYIGENEYWVVFSDTGTEHDTTMQYLADAKKLCANNDIPFYHIRGEWRTGTWKNGLVGMWEATSTIGSAAFAPSCSPRLKTVPIYRFLAHEIPKTYGYTAGIKGVKAFTRERGTISMHIGFAKGEEGRLPATLGSQTTFAFAQKSTPIPKWRQEAFTLVFPLIDMGLDRAGCQAYLQTIGAITPEPSQCIFCPFKSPLEILWTKRRYPEQFAKWMMLEQQKIKAWSNEDFRKARQRPEKFKPNGFGGYKNLGVSGKFDEATWQPKTLLDTIAEAEIKYADWTDQQLDEHRFSHGHCMKFKQGAV